MDATEEEVQCGPAKMKPVAPIGGFSDSSSRTKEPQEDPMLQAEGGATCEEIEVATNKKKEKKDVIFRKENLNFFCFVFCFLFFFFFCVFFFLSLFC